MKRGLQLTVIVLSLAILSSCAPKTFVETTDMASSWSTVQLRENITYEEAWNNVIDLLVKKFDMNILAQEDGYIRTNWRYTWTGEMNEDYRVRATIKFSPDQDKLQIKSEAEYRLRGTWVKGYDTRLLSTLKSDIMGQVGRTTR